MRTKSTKKTLTFGELVASLYHTYGKRKGPGILRLLIKAELVGFQGRNPFALTRGKRKS